MATQAVLETVPAAFSFSFGFTELGVAIGAMTLFWNMKNAQNERMNKLIQWDQNEHPLRILDKAFSALGAYQSRSGVLTDPEAVKEAQRLHKENYELARVAMRKCTQKYHSLSAIHKRFTTRYIANQLQNQLYMLELSLAVMEIKQKMASEAYSSIEEEVDQATAILQKLYESDDASNRTEEFKIFMSILTNIKCISMFRMGFIRKNAASVKTDQKIVDILEYALRDYDSKNFYTHILLGYYKTRDLDFVSATYQEARRAEIAKHFAAAQTLAGKNADVLNFEGYYFYKIGDYTKARWRLEEALVMDPMNIAYMSTMGKIMLKLGKKERALHYLKSAWQRQTTNCHLIGMLMYCMDPKEWEEIKSACELQYDFDNSEQGF